MIPQVIDNTILIIQDDVQSSQSLEAILDLKGYSPFFCTEIQTALEAISLIEYQLIIIDLKQDNDRAKIIDAIPSTSRSSVIILRDDIEGVLTKDNKYFATCYKNDLTEEFTNKVKSLIWASWTKSGTVCWIENEDINNVNKVDFRLNHKSGHILLVEDNKVNQMLALANLKKLNYSVDIAENGIEALDKCAENSYDIILMDLMMPLMDGITAAKELRARGIYTPIIALTSNVFEQDNCLEAGMNSILTKPCHKQDSLDQLQSVLIAA